MSSLPPIRLGQPPDTDAMSHAEQKTLVSTCTHLRASLMAVFTCATVMASTGSGCNNTDESAHVMHSNLDRHNRSHDTIALDHGYNLLDSCEQDAILFTLGDNETYPLWYIQQIAGYRTDVTIINVSLLNAPWYIRQLRDEPRSSFFAEMPDDFIDRRLSGGMSSFTTLNWSVEPSSMAAAGIRWLMPPSWVAPDSSYGMRSVANYLTVRIIDETKWSRPIYLTVPTSRKLNLGLGPYLVMEGLVFRLDNTPAGNGRIRIDTGKMTENFHDVYRLDSITNPSLYRSPDMMSSLDIYFDLVCELMYSHADDRNWEQAVDSAMLAQRLAEKNPGWNYILTDVLRQTGIDNHLREKNGGTAP